MNRLASGALVLLLALVACADGPREVIAGAEECAHCRMLASDERFTSQLLSERGRHYIFDSIECMVEFLDAEEVLPESDIRSLWVTDFADPGSWVEVAHATFLHSDEIRSPMGMNLSAFESPERAREARDAFGGEILDWEGVRSLVQMQGGDHGHTHGPVHDAAHTPSEAAEHDGDLVVSPDGPIRTLGEALALANDGDRIRVGPGTYREGTLVIDRSIELVGEDWPVLDGESEGSILVVTADDVQIRGFVLRNSGMSHIRDHAAITVEESEGCRIENNRLEDNFFGIFLARAMGCLIRDNRITASGTREATSGNGIHLWDVDRVQVEGNEIRGHRDGIYLEFARGAVIRENRSEDNIRYGLHFMFSDDSFYVNNSFRNNGAGVAVMYSRNVVMSRNRFVDNWGSSAYGLLLKEVQDSLIEDNLFRGNTTAIHSEGSDRLTFRLNQVERNGWAVKILANSQDNLFTMNNFVDNTFDVITNSRRNPNSFEGNHWSQYRGYDLEGDGVGDLAHRPVRLFSLIVQERPAAIVLLRSFFVDILEVAERVLPVLTPETLVDERPLMRAVQGVEPWR
jgi:nitrous oxidase accessory protein